MNANRRLRACLASAAALVAANLLGASPAQAFCVYNKTNAKITVTQVGGGGDRAKQFKAELVPGKESCCNWQTGDCNSGGKRTSKVTFAAWIDVYPYPNSTLGHKFPYLLCAADAIAGGWLNVVGNLANADPPPHMPVADKQWGDSISCKSYTGMPSIVGKGSKLCLDVGGWEDRNGASVITWDCHGGLNQRWEFTKEQEIRGFGDRCLDVSGASTADGAKVHMWDCNGGNQQKWRLDGEQIIGVGSNKCLDVWAQQTTKGAGLQIFNCTGRDNQKWSKRDE